jgi:hypothetical protein
MCKRQIEGPVGMYVEAGEAALGWLERESPLPLLQPALVSRLWHHI